MSSVTYPHCKCLQVFNLPKLCIKQAFRINSTLVHYFSFDTVPVYNGAFRDPWWRHDIAALHYIDVIMTMMASQITILTVVYSPFIQTQVKENIKAPRHWPLCGEFTGDRWIPHTKGQLHGKCFQLMTSSCSTILVLWTNGHRFPLHFVEGQQMQSFMFSSFLRPIKLLNAQSNCQWFEMPWSSCDTTVVPCCTICNNHTVFVFRHSTILSPYWTEKVMARYTLPTSARVSNKSWNSAVSHIFRKETENVFKNVNWWLGVACIFSSLPVAMVSAILHLVLSI